MKNRCIQYCSYSEMYSLLHHFITKCAIYILFFHKQFIKFFHTNMFVFLLSEQCFLQDVVHFTIRSNNKKDTTKLTLHLVCRLSIIILWMNSSISSPVCSCYTLLKIRKLNVYNADVYNTLMHSQIYYTFRMYIVIVVSPTQFSFYWNTSWS